MNNSTSTTSAGWPTRWPADSFRFGPTALLVLAVIGVGGAVFLGGMGWLLAAYGTQLRHGGVPIVPAIFFQLVLEGAVVVAILVGLPRVSRLSLRELGFTAIKPWQIGVALLGAIAMIVTVEGGATLIQALTHQKHEQQVVELFRSVMGQPATMWFFASFAVILAPFMEETIFRIFVFNVGLRRGGFWTGAIVSGLLFGSAHGDVFVLAPLAAGGMVLCYVYYRTRNAYASMITHAIFNAVTIFALIYAPKLAN